MKKRSQEHSHQLFSQVMERLSVQGDPYDTIPDILQATCRFFRFGCGFIYESNHAQVCYLKETYCYYESDNLPPALEMYSFFTPDQVRELIDLGTVIIAPGHPESALTAKLRELFTCQLLVLVPIMDNDGMLIGLVGMSDRRGGITLSVTDFEVALSVLSMVANQVKLRIYQTRVENTRNALESTMDNMGIDIYVTDLATHEIIYANSSMARPFGGLHNLIGKKCWQALHNGRTGPCDYCPGDNHSKREGSPCPVFSWDYQQPRNGSWLRMFSACFRWVDGRMARVVSSFDISDNKRNEEIILRLAEYDELTGLPNRRKLALEIDEAIANGAGNAYVIFFDLDGFKRVNDDLSHRAGDELLVQIGKMLQASPITSGHCYRHSGDEFVLIYDDISVNHLFMVTSFLLENFQIPWRLQDGEVQCTASIGIAHYPSDGQNAAELLHTADLAMYASKPLGRGKVHFYNQGSIISDADWSLSNQEPTDK